MRNADLRPINLTVLHEDATLSVSLTDTRSLARYGRIDVRQGLLDEITARATATLRLQNSASPEAIARAPAQIQRRELGGAVFSQLLPAGIRAFLVQSPPRCLILQISASLMAIPWEIAFDGEDFLGEKFQVSRQIVCDDEIPAPSPARADRTVLKVLIINGCDPEPPHEGRAGNLLRRLRAMPETSANAVRTGELRHDEALRLMGDSDVVHFVGPVCARAGAWWERGEDIVREIAALPNPPQLIVAENTAFGHSDVSTCAGNHALARAACRAGLNIVVRDAAPRDDGGVEFMPQIYQEIARGSALGEAVRQARAAFRRQSDMQNAACPDAALYGDATLTLMSPRMPGPAHDELRQVTILSHDLVDSTKLLGTMGAERYSDLLATYHQRCADVVAKHGGVSDDPQGDDGIMCYFGVPVAREDSAVRALQAGLEILGAIAELGVNVRIGVATGQVVVKAGQPVGAAIHLAARLQAVAEPGTLVISDTTRQIVKEQFDLQRLDQIPRLKGFDRPAVVYRVLRASRTDGGSRFDAAPKLTPFVGREPELRRIEEHWASARTGGARTVLVCGEAGIGKSRLVHEFKQSVVLQGGDAIEGRCTPDHVSSAFYPVIDLIRRLLNIRDSDSAESKLDKIERAMAPIGAIEGAAQLIGALLSIPIESRYTPLEYSAERRRQLTLDVLAKWICRETGKTPVCLIVEDVQWADPSTKEFLHRLIAEARELPLLLLLTERTEAAQPPNPGIEADAIELKGLSPEATRAMILGASGASSIPDAAVRLLADKADGVPLFIEESTRMVIDLSAESEDADTEPALRFAVPATIQDLLMARLDRLASAKPVAQLGGAIGREFSLALAQSVLAHESSPIRVGSLAVELGTLVTSGLLIEKGEAPDTSYFFKHALVRDAAYLSLWERDRKKLHRAIAITIGEKFQALAQSQPELLAYHYAEAGMDVEAVACWERAARRAASRFAHAEALSHLASGLALIARLPATPVRDRAELNLQLLLAGQLIATRGYGADQVGRVYTRAATLCRAIGDEGVLTKIQLGLEGYHFMRADFDQAQAIASQAATMAARAADPMRRLQSQWAVANILFHRGELVSAVEQMDACLGEYQRTPPRPRTVQDPGVMCLCYSAWGKWELGYPDQARERARQAIVLSERLNHKFSIGEAYGFCTAVDHFRGDDAEGLKCATRAIEICEDNGFAVWLAHAKLMRGRIVAELGDAEAGITEMREAYDMWAATGAIVTTPFYLAMQAEGLALAGRPDEGLTLLERAFGIARKYGERYYEAEIRRLFGELTLQSAARGGANRSEEAERWFLGAIECAREKRLHSLVLRGATSLGRLRLAQNRPAEGMRVLAPAYERFEEGENTRDLRRARALIEELRLGGADAQ